MKKLLPILLVFLGLYLFVSPSKAFAATLCWAGSAGGSWSTAGNWITTSGSVSGSAPGSGDTATFDPSKTICTGGTPANTNSTVDAGFGGTVGGVRIVSGYTQTITQNHDLTISGNPGYVQASGTWDGSAGSSAFTINTAGAAPFTLSGGTFKASSGTLTYSPTSSSTWNTTGGTFTAGTGTVDFNNSELPTYTITNSTTFNNLKFTGGNNSGVQIDISSGTTLTANGTLSLFTDTVPGEPTVINGPGGITARGNIAVSGQGAIGGVVITIAGTGSQLFSGDGTAAINQVPAITINKTSGTLTFQNTIAPRNDWTYIAGNLVTTGSTIRFLRDDDSVIVNITGSMTFNNLTFFGENNNGISAAIASGTNLTVTGTLTFDDENVPTETINGPGTITAQGNIITDHQGATGSVPIILSGSSNQTVNAAGTNFPTGTVTFNKPSGTITMASNWVLNTAGQDLTVQAGSNQTITGGTNILLVNDQFTINGTLNQGTVRFITGTASGAYVVSATGVWNNTSTGEITFGPGGLDNTGTVLFDGTQAGCGDADGITIDTSNNAAVPWSGAGTFTLYDLNITQVHSSVPLTAYSSTDSGDNTGITFDGTCPVAPTPTPTPAPTSPPSDNSSSSNNSSGSNSAPTCNASVPNSAPNLFEIDAAGTFVNLYFVGLRDPVTGYNISYGLDSNANQYSDNYPSLDKDWVNSRTIYWLNPNSTYYFRVQGANNCSGGAWSQTVAVKTKGRLADIAGLINKLNPFAKIPMPQSNSSASSTGIAGCSYQVQSGDSLWSIAQNKWGSGNRYHDIVALNSELANSSVIHSGQTLILCN